jgi:SHS2 domain-containing protein
MYETFEHTADMGLRVTAPDLAGLFEEAACGLFSLLVSGVPESNGRVREIRIPGERHDYLLLDWLAELLSLSSAETVWFDGFSVQLDDRGITARAREHSLLTAGITVLTEIKAITYHGLKLERSPDGWVAEIVVDV